MMVQKVNLPAPPLFSPNTNTPVAIYDIDSDPMSDKRVIEGAPCQLDEYIILAAWSQLIWVFKETMMVYTYASIP